MPTADRQRATVQVKVSIVDRDPRILPEMGARVDFLDTARVATASRDAAGPPRFRLPSAAVRELNRQTVVWLVRNGKLESRAGRGGPGERRIPRDQIGTVGRRDGLTGGVETPKAGMRVKRSAVIALHVTLTPRAAQGMGAEAVRLSELLGGHDVSPLPSLALRVGSG